ncbi:MAG: CRISPR-associated protein Cas4 [Candidatus Lokiarchaeota archaeon]|nr:CRISPR-associated protein Cas4 [Candidatus Lokiarchaeota archaeon]MBD3202444.1 CRISPR-associated protein Cas4 [Candidatus Lokiarchaeota archaeon]
MKEQNNDRNILNQYILKNSDLNEIRVSYPRVNLYHNPIIGSEEIRQYVYCKRIIFFRHVLHAPMKQTYKMEYGVKKHEKLQEIANKEKEASQKYFNVYLTDPDSSLVGLIDYFEFDGNEAYPVEIKSGNLPPDGLDNPHKLQVAAQALLIEKNFDFLVKKVRIFYTKHHELVEYPIDIEDKLKVLKIVEEIETLIDREKIPEPTKHQGKCVDCECKSYCLRA